MQTKEILYKIWIVSLLLLSVSCSSDKQGKKSEAYEPLIHFSPKARWMTSPTGVYFDNSYHLFYLQSDHADNSEIVWGHATSSNLLAWNVAENKIKGETGEELLGGSIVFDEKKKSTFASSSSAPLLLYCGSRNIETGIKQPILFYSIDKGKTWNRYEEPLLKADFLETNLSDPKVFWHADANQWVMLLSTDVAINIFTSEDGTDWNYSSTFATEGADTNWASPDLFPLTVEGTNETKWVLSMSAMTGPLGISSTQYFVGDWDGKSFTSTTKDPLNIDYGNDCFSMLTWAGTEGRTIVSGWMNNWSYAGTEPHEEWSGSMSLPRELSLIKDRDIFFLTSAPINELAGVAGKRAEYENVKITDYVNLHSDIDLENKALAINLVFDNSQNTAITFPPEYGLVLTNAEGERLTISYNNIFKNFLVDRTKSSKLDLGSNFNTINTAPYILSTDEVEWTIIVDKTSIEFFTANNKLAMTNLYYSTSPFTDINLFTESGSILLKKAAITELIP